MGLCILFPALCGLRTTKVAEMKQITAGICSTLERNLEGEESMPVRQSMIDAARAEAITLLAQKGYNPYE